MIREKKYIPIVIHLLSNRIEVLKKRLSKLHGEDWYDYEDDQQLIKMRDLDTELDNLCYAHDDMQERLNLLNRMN